MAASPSDALKLGQQNGAKFVDLRFSDLPGLMQHFSMPFEEFGEEAFEEGIGFDGSSIRGFQEIQESDMILVPDPETAVMDPFRKHPTLVIHAFVKDPVTGEFYSRDPRYIAKKAQDYLIGTGIADTAYFGPEAEFYIFDSIRFDQNQHSGYYHIDAVEGVWNSGREEEGGNKGYKPRYKEGYFPVPPMDHYQDLRSEMVLTLRELGVPVEVHHHEVGTAGQAEIDMGFSALLSMADRLMLYKYTVKNVGHQYGKTITFMPKPIFQDNGSGMHVHQSLWKDGEPLFWDELGYAQLSDTARWYIGGLLEHAPALLALCAPTTNSFKRLVPGYEAPVNLVYSQRNRSAAVRIPLYSKSPKSKRIEFRCPDPSCNPYLAFPALLMAGLDGIKNKIEPPDPVDKDLYDLPPEELAEVPQVPGSLEGALDALESDHDFLLEGGVFTEDVISHWIDYKRTREVDEIRLRPHPWEFYLYYDI
ncbi:MAG TPA: type I glutamate--ammonia ligase [Actinomycetota bacterium]|jgi:glutamine synthetase|nr:type I glutamate--ammonia ligase [Actinomycetota bacterium]